ncbi:MAG: hypothetical protein II858_04120 [Bacteroidales bacterium]|nr:hypothetical protein [Bacteroidales bacterium]
MKRIVITLFLLIASLACLPVSAQSKDQGPYRHDLLGLTPSSRDSRTGEILDQTAWELLYYKPAQIKEFADQLCTRIKWDIKVTDEMGDGTRPKDAALDKALLDEFLVFSDFLLRIGMIAEQHTNVRMKRNAQGEWSYSLTPAPEFETKLWMEHVPKAKKKATMNGYAVCMVNGAYYFCERPLGGDFIPVILDEDELYVANVAFGLIRNIGLIFENGALDIVKDVYKRDHDQFERPYRTCQLYLEAVSKALENNDKIEIKYQPMPAAGKMNASMKAKVLPLEKAITDKVVDCVVTSDGWKVETDAAGTPIRRVIYGYSIVETKRGKQATRVSWAEDYQGGGQYGALHAYGVGGGKFYVK